MIDSLNITMEIDDIENGYIVLNPKCIIAIGTTVDLKGNLVTRILLNSGHTILTRDSIEKIKDHIDKVFN